MPTTSVENPGLVLATPPASHASPAFEPASFTPTERDAPRAAAGQSEKEKERDKKGITRAPKPKPRFSRTRNPSHERETSEPQDTYKTGALLLASICVRGDKHAEAASAFQRKGVCATIAVFEQRNTSPPPASLASPTKRSPQPTASPTIGATPVGLKANSSSHSVVAAAASLERTSRVSPPVDYSKKPALDLSRFTKHPSMRPPPSSSASATSTTNANISGSILHSSQRVTNAKKTKADQ